MPGQKILIIDDNQSLRDALRDGLTSVGFEVIEATDGDEGLAAAYTNKPDLILLDIMMPKMNGYQVLKLLRADAWGKDVKVLLLTSLDDISNIAQGVELKSNEYIIKSNESLQSILKKVKQHLVGYV